MRFGLAKAAEPTLTEAPGAPEGQTRNSGRSQGQDPRPQRATSPARSPRNCHQPPQPEPGLPSTASTAVGRVSPPLFL